MANTIETATRGKLIANGVALHFTMMGQGTPIVLIHGWMGSSYHWRKLMPLLAERHTVVVFDTRGYGDSDKPASGYDGRTIVADVRDLARQLQLGKYFILGHDMGALPALLLAAEHPD